MLSVVLPGVTMSLGLYTSDVLFIAGKDIAVIYFATTVTLSTGGSAAGYRTTEATICASPSRINNRSIAVTRQPWRPTSMLLYRRGKNLRIALAH